MGISNRSLSPLYCLLPWMGGLMCTVLVLFVERTNTFTLLLLYALTFSWYLLYSFHNLNREIQLKNILPLLISTLPLLFLWPNLSDDFYRFMWDGDLINAGINPYHFTPIEILEKDDLLINKELLLQMNSAGYYSVYPPLLQFLFYLASALSFGSLYLQMILLKFPLVFAWIGSGMVLIKILNLSNIPTGRSLLYIANPLVLIEVLGNIHHEGIQVFFMLMGIYWIMKEKILPAGIYWGLAAGTKLLPILIIPLLVKYLGLRKGLIFGCITLMTLGISFLPFFQLYTFENIGQSIGLYFQTFEFNASVFFLVREAGYLWKGYNVIQIAGPALGLIWLLILLSFFVRLKENNFKQFIRFCIWSFATYYFLATTVHPWYLITILALATIDRIYWVIIWTGLVFLSYTFYTSSGVIHHSEISWIQYGILTLAIIYEKKFSYLVSIISKQSKSNQ